MNRFLADGMVLQRNQEFRLSGIAKVGNLIKASIAGLKIEVFCENEEYSLCIPAMGAGGPYELKLYTDKDTKIYQDIYVGDIFVLSGQSNMELPISWFYDTCKEEVDFFECEQIRQFKVPVSYNFEAPQREVTGGEWRKALGSNKQEFSAVGFFFAKQMWELTGVPIGLILAAVCGAPIEAFLSRKHQITPPKDYSTKLLEKRLKWENLSRKRWYETLKQSDSGFTNQGTMTTRLPGLILNSGVGTYGVIWLHKQINIPKCKRDVQSLTATLNLGMLVEEDETYINGVLVGHTDNQYPTRKYLVPQGVLHAGCNDISIRIINTRGVFRAIEGQNYSLEIEEKCYFLAGEWQFQIGVIDNQWIPKQTVLQYLPYGVYNQMLAPLSNIEITGILWYQGESNAGQPIGYCDKMEKLLEQFRDLFHKQDIPFVYVQLPDYVDPFGESGKGLEELQKQQQEFADRNLKGVRMIPYLDVEDKFNLHPTDKKVVGERLAAGILALRED